MYRWFFRAAGIIFGALVLGCVLYVLFGLRRFSFMRQIREKHGAVSWLLCLLFLVPLGIYSARHLVAGLIILVHLTLFWMIADLLGRFLWHRDKPYLPGALAVAVTFLYLAAGWYLCHHVAVTRYQLETEKNLGRESLRIVQISDSHLGFTLDGEDFAREMEKVQREEPDLVVTGDFVDDDSKRADMERSCEALGSLETTYGVFFVYGNHDKGYFGNRDFGDADLRKCLADAGVIILEDEAAELNEGITLVGRQDRQTAGRASMASLAENIPKERYMIVLDHQPNDFAAEEAAGADLVLSGHTHGGQMIPIGAIGLAMGANDSNYGLTHRGGTDFIVNSGISDWAIPFKTGTFSEIGVIEVRQKGSE